MLTVRHPHRMGPDPQAVHRLRPSLSASCHRTAISRRREVISRRREVISRHHEVVSRHREVVSRHREERSDPWTATSLRSSQ
jgi:1,2-phenylacetyl-CoA epoxidase PaaB subunit